MLSKSAYDIRNTRPAHAPRGCVAPMKIISITVGGFRNVRRTEFLLDGIVPIVAGNNYGKSNVFDAISLGTSFFGMICNILAKDVFRD